MSCLPIWIEMHLAAMVQQPARGFQTQQAAADHHRPLALLCARNDSGAVIQRPESEHALLQPAIRPLQSVHRWNECPAASRDQQLIVLQL